MGWYKTEEPQVMKLVERKLPACMVEGTLLHLISEEAKKGREVVEEGALPPAANMAAASKMIAANKAAAKNTADLKAKGKEAKKRGWDKPTVDTYKGPHAFQAAADKATAKNTSRDR
jgi:hypothetical protein